MAISVFLGIILFVGIVAGISLAVVSYNKNYSYYSKSKNPTKKGIVTGLVIALVALILLITIPGSFHTVQTGEVAVIKTLGEAKDVKGPGTSFDFWMIKSYEMYDTKVQNVDITTAAYSSDAQTMDVAMTLQYQIMSDKVLDIAKQYGSLQALQTRIQSIAIEKTKAVLSSHKAMDIIADRASISPAVEDAIKTAVGEEYFVSVTTVVLTNIDFSDAFEQAVEDKMIAEQAKLKADYENEKKVAQAAADAEAKKVAAQAEIDIAKAEAEAKLIEAQAEADANKLIADSLTEIILEKLYADKWNGELPDVIGSGDYILPGDIIG